MQKNFAFQQRRVTKKILIFLSLVIISACCGCQSNNRLSRPVIGITSVYQVDTDNGSASALIGFAYIKAIAENGGVPVILPTITNEEIMMRYVEELDGLVLVGGADIPPDAYGQQPHETVKVIPEQRYNFERQFIPAWLSSGKPILGVCLGMQFTNVVSGGTLIQDIPSQVGTEVAHRRKYHDVRVQPDSSLAKLLGKQQAKVYSNHHQAVDKLGNNLKVIAHADDNVIEALERVEGGFGLFVQWHPEVMKDIEHRNAIYGALVRAAVQTNDEFRKSERH
ncbi:MAG: gamma-glutamyl-gamma-aminobutyrate hydrolase family protein [Planctomycetota bacterium]|jgi:putative glutamine amidotransferase